MNVSLIDYLFEQGSYDAYVRERLAELYEEIFFDDNFFDAFWDVFGYESYKNVRPIDIVGFMFQYALIMARKEIKHSDKLSEKDKKFLLDEIDNVSVDASYGFTVYECLDEFMDNVSKELPDLYFGDIGICCKFVSDIKKFGVKNLIKED